MGEPERCEVCGFVWDDVGFEECSPRIRIAATSFAELLAANPEASTIRPSEETWSAVEYGCHVRDVLFNLRDRIVLGAAEDVPQPPALHGLARIEWGLYDDDLPETVAVDLSVAADLFARTWERLPDDRRERTLIYGWPVRMPRTLTWVAAQALHEVEHHLADAIEGVAGNRSSYQLAPESDRSSVPGGESGSPMNIYGIEHVQLAMPVGREAVAVSFYEGVLGLTHVPKPPHLAVRGGCWFETEGVHLHLGVTESFVPATKAHPALLVRSLPELIRVLEEHLIAVTIDQPLEGFDRCYAHDPFGNRIEFMERVNS